VYPDIAQQIASDLERAGIRVKLKGLGGDNFFQVIQDPKNKDHMAFAGWVADYPDGAAFLEPVLLSAAANGGSNYGEFQDPAFDAEMRRIRAMPPGAERRAAYAQLAYATAADQAPWAMLYTQKATNLTSTRYGGYYYDATKGLALGLAYLTE
jgi:ABC-type transport system substrate-binding protein